MLTDRQEAIKDLEKLLKSKKNNLNQQNLRRHWAVLALLYSTKKRKANETQMEMAENIARNYNKGVYFAKKIVSWENQWLINQKITLGQLGCFAKSFSWFNDKSVQLEVRRWCASAGESK